VQTKSKAINDTKMNWNWTYELGWHSIFGLYGSFSSISPFNLGHQITQGNCL